MKITYKKSEHKLPVKVRGQTDQEFWQKAADLMDEIHQDECTHDHADMMLDDNNIMWMECLDCGLTHETEAPDHLKSSWARQGWDG